MNKINFTCMEEGCAPTQDGYVIELKSRYGILFSSKGTGKIFSGITIDIPERYIGILVPHNVPSSRGLRFQETLNVVSSGQDAEISVDVFNDAKRPLRIAQHETFAKLFIVPCYVGELEEKSVSSTDTKDQEA